MSPLIILTQGNFSQSLPVTKNDQEQLVFSSGIAHHKIASAFRDSDSWRYFFFPLSDVFLKSCVC